MANVKKKKTEVDSSVLDRLNLLVQEFEDGKHSAFGKKVGLIAAKAQQLLKGDSGLPSTELMLKVFAAYPQVNPGWLDKGLGSMRGGAETTSPAAGTSKKANAKPVSSSKSAVKPSVKATAKKPAKPVVKQTIKTAVKTAPAAVQEPTYEEPEPEELEQEPEEEGAENVIVDWRFCADTPPTPQSLWWTKRTWEFAPPVTGELAAELFAPVNNQPLLRVVAVLRLSGQRTYVADSRRVVEGEEGRTFGQEWFDEKNMEYAGWRRLPANHRRVPGPAAPLV